MGEYAPAPVRAFVEWLPDGFAWAGPGVDGVRRGRCIEAARILIAFCSRVGIPARALACDVVAMNLKAWGLLRCGFRGNMADVPDAWTVGALCDRQTPGGNLQERHRQVGFGGHLVVAGDDWYVDITAPQFSRPEHGIVVPNAIEGPYVPGDSGVEVMLDHGVIRWVWRPEIKRWRTMPAWRQDIAVGVLDELVRRVTQPPLSNALDNATMPDRDTSGRDHDRQGG